MKVLQNSQVRFWLIALAWFLYGQVIFAGISSGLLAEVGDYLGRTIGNAIPSIARLDESRGALRRAHASLLLVSMPFLFAAFLLADVERFVEGIRKKGTEEVSVFLFLLLGSCVFFAGFDSRRLNGSLFIFSIGSSFITLISAYFYRAAYCIAFQSPDRKPIAHGSMRNELEWAVDVFSSFLKGRAGTVICLPPLKDVSASIRFLGKRRRMNEECRLALMDLESSPPIISQRLLAVAENFLKTTQSSSPGVS